MTDNEFNRDEPVEVGQVRVILTPLYDHNVGAKFVVSEIYSADVIFLGIDGRDYSLPSWWVRLNTKIL